METKGGGLGKMFSKAFSGESMFQNHYTARGGTGMIAFTSSFPGEIKVLEIGPGKEMIVQKSAFLQSQKKEIQEAIAAGNSALETADSVLPELQDAAGWTTWDMIGGGGIITHMAVGIEGEKRKIA